MRTTLSIDDDVLRRAAAMAAEEGLSLDELITETLREYLARPQGSAERQIGLPTSGGHGVVPGVDLSDNAAVRDIMDAK